jgi:hypothetical protein
LAIRDLVGGKKKRRLATSAKEQKIAALIHWRQAIIVDMS